MAFVHYLSNSFLHGTVACGVMDTSKVVNYLILDTDIQKLITV